ncbi:MAG: hypothetical protein M1837_002891 [Sclerophora amabilis]|nr:MAG: hypothetical protein M1837_002891 [Sclerophora amabilis]
MHFRALTAAVVGFTASANAFKDARDVHARDELAARAEAGYRRDAELNNELAARAYEQGLERGRDAGHDNTVTVTVTTIPAYCLGTGTSTGPYATPGSPGPGEEGVPPSVTSGIPGIPGIGDEGSPDYGTPGVPVTGGEGVGPTGTPGVPVPGGEGVGPSGTPVVPIGVPPVISNPPGLNGTTTAPPYGTGVGAATTGVFPGTGASVGPSGSGSNASYPGASSTAAPSNGEGSSPGPSGTAAASTPAEANGAANLVAVTWALTLMTLGLAWTLI